MNIPNVLKPQNPVLSEKVVASIQDQLKLKLTWLDYAFGVAQSMSKEKDGRRVKYPAVYIGMDEYYSVLPNDQLGNSCFFKLDDPAKVEPPFHQPTVKQSASVIFWVNLDTIYSDRMDRRSESLKSEIMRALTYISTPEGRFDIESIYEKSENVYRGYSFSEIDAQFNTHPYVAFRFEGTLTYNQTCL